MSTSALSNDDFATLMHERRTGVRLYTPDAAAKAETVWRNICLIASACIGNGGTGMPVRGGRYEIEGFGVLRFLVGGGLLLRVLDDCCALQDAIEPLEVGGPDRESRCFEVAVPSSRSGERFRGDMRLGRHIFITVPRSASDGGRMRTGIASSRSEVDLDHDFTVDFKPQGSTAIDWLKLDPVVTYAGTDHLDLMGNGCDMESRMRTWAERGGFLRPEGEIGIGAGHVQNGAAWQARAPEVWRTPGERDSIFREMALQARRTSKPLMINFERPGEQWMGNALRVPLYTW